MYSDTMADCLTRIRNAARNGAKTVSMPYSKAKAAVCNVLRDEGYIAGFDKIENDKSGVLRVELKYGPHGEAVITFIQRYSRVGRRVYRGWREMPRVLDGMGISVVSTSHGVLSDRQCRAKKVGGEVICTVY